MDPSALERGLQYLRDGGFRSLEVATLGSKGMKVSFHFEEASQTHIDFTAPAQPLYSECDCSMAGYGIFCKHQACASWVFTVLTSKKYDLTRVEESVYETLRKFEPDLESLKSPSSASPSQPILHRESGYVSHPPVKADFEGLVFNLKNLWIGPDQPRPEWTHQLTPGAAHEGALLSDIAIPFYRESELPHPLWRSPISFRGSLGPPFQNPLETARKRSIYYLFSDGTRIPVSEILFHRNSLLVPTELLPIASNLAEEDRNSARHRFFPRSKDLPVWDLKADERLDSILLAVTKAASRLLARGKLKAWLSFQDVWHESHSALSLDKIEFQQPEHLKSGFQVRGYFNEGHTPASEIRLELAPDWGWLETCAVKTGTRELFFHPYHHWLSDLPPTVICDKPSRFETLFNRLQDDFHANMSEIHADPPFEFLRSESFIPHLRVFSNGTFSVELQFEFGTIDGIPGPVLKHLQVLNQGIRAFDEALSEQLFQGKKQAKRAGDLRLFRHIGLAALTQQETIRHLIRRDRPFPEFFEHLKSRLAVLMNKLEGAPHSPHLALETFCSKSAIEFLESYVRSLESLYDEKLFPLAMPGKNVLISGVFAFYLKLIYSWITLAQTQSQGAILLRTKDGVLRNAAFDDPDGFRDLQVFETPDEAKTHSATEGMVATEETA
ncbi:MAG: hypothetical protein EBX52_09195, partial [Proteobacteria bacterium]|nr:hypothetical protein [Pseudomonadota bacterium]